ncbi:hypothetical protein KGF56_002046 [Candida oxycetoniae]|uniref:F-box domain-containing protein n=1 Tax=Candida oxycetoniae TaxID=497107 RepID=A0AAI9WYJ0_9ASCO|nr:uncharacterized protein KGF56_002046 [Candida oxycetoniae]KAI3405090.2 hypothetical protein KGF56_002046 [Candida oxycetoniae]
MSLTAQSLLGLPPHILKKIISYLPQQSLINLATTNYEFYHPCLQRLYSRIVITETPPLRSYASLKPKSRSSDGGVTDLLTARKVDLQDGSRVTIYGFRHSHDYELNLRMVHARLVVLLQALEINPDLVSYIQEVHVFGEFNDVIINDIQKLADKLSSLDCFYISNASLRQVLNLDKLCLKKFVIVEGNGINQQEEHHHYVEQNKRQLVGSQVSLSPSQLTSLILADDEYSYWSWFRKAVFAKSIQFPNMRKFKLVFNSSDMNMNTLLVNSITWDNMQELELIIPYTTESSDPDDYVLDCLTLLPSSFPKLKKLSIVQGSVFPTHAANESFDLNILNFVSQVCSNLTYLSIKHKLPILGNFPDGVEGNYRRRYDMFMTVLPKIINRYSSNNRLTLVLPNLFQTFACYEQYMNTVLFNGCKCEHCDEFLTKLDDYMMHHKYHCIDTHQYKDMNVSHLFSVIGEFLNHRMIQDDLITQLDQLSFPLWNHHWDFHKVTNHTERQPFKCYEKKVIDHGEYDEGATSDVISTDECEFTKRLYANIPKCISHYTNDMVQAILNLHRGNAERRADEQEHTHISGVDSDVFADTLKDGGDLDTLRKFNIRKIIINGIVYNIGSELNGTHYYVNVYDDE